MSKKKRSAIVSPELTLDYYRKKRETGNLVQRDIRHTQQTTQKNYFDNAQRPTPNTVSSPQQEKQTREALLFVLHRTKREEGGERVREKKKDPKNHPRSKNGKTGRKLTLSPIGTARGRSQFTQRRKEGPLCIFSRTHRQDWYVLNILLKRHTGKMTRTQKNGSTEAQPQKMRPLLVFLLVTATARAGESE